MKALAITLGNKHVILRGAERCSKGNKMKLFMTAGNYAWKNDEKVRTHYKDYAEFIRIFLILWEAAPVTKVDIHYNRTFGKGVIQSKYWIGKYSEDDIIWADEEENYRPFAPMN